MIVEQFQPVPRGGILYDAARLRKPEAALFTREYWAARNELEEFAGGRGTVCALRAQEGDWILRHYRRGGFAARISSDRYLWRGVDETRSFREWRLLAELRQRGLPVPAPVAAHFERDGPFYRADLITVRIANARTLAETARDRRLDEAAWYAIGRTIARFHAAGVHHADLNANNIMLADEDVYLLDFDRGRIRARGGWEDAVIARLQRSLQKLKAKHPAMRFGASEWEALLAGVATSP